MRSAKLLVALCWVPLGLVGLMYWEARKAEAWGAWAMAVFFVPPIVASSIVLTLTGLVLNWREWRRGIVNRTLIAATLCASAPLTLILLRMAYLNIVQLVAPSR